MPAFNTGTSEDWHFACAVLALTFLAGTLPSAISPHRHITHLQLALSARKDAEGDGLTEARKQERDEWVAREGVARLGGGDGSVVRPLIARDGTEVVAVIDKDTLYQRRTTSSRLKFAKMHNTPWSIAPFGKPTLKTADSSAADGSEHASAPAVVIDGPALAKCVEESPEGRALGLRKSYRDERFPYWMNRMSPIIGARLLKEQLVVPLLSAVTVVGKLTLVDSKLTLTAHPTMGMYVVGGTLASLRDVIARLKRTRDRQALLSAALIGVVALNISCIAAPGWIGRARDRLVDTVNSAVDWCIPGRAAARRAAAVAAASAGMERLEAYTAAEAAALEANALEASTSMALPSECIVCFERRVDCAFSPCGHLACCQVCARRIFSSNLPAERKCCVCRRPISSLLRVFVSGLPPPPPAAPGEGNGAGANA